MTTPPIISDEYRQLNIDLHRLDPTYGTTGRRYVSVLRELAWKYKAAHMLDYGCGKQDLAKALGNDFDVRSFDPAIAGLDAPPAPADLVACIDVLEHVEPEFLDNVLADLVRVTRIAAYFTIATLPSSKHLSDGRNCHRIINDKTWWLKRLEERFVCTHITSYDSCLQVIAKPIHSTSGDSSHYRAPPNHRFEDRT
jgi:hypothetical protein